MAKLALSDDAARGGFLSVIETGCGRPFRQPVPHSFLQFVLPFHPK
jgi:hypothetical protein